MKNRTIETHRLCLRTFRKTDIKNCFTNYGQDTELGKFLPMYPVKNEMEMANIITGYINSYENGAYIWLVEEKRSKEPIGYIGVSIPYKELNIGQISYLLGTKYQKQGYAFEAVSAAIHYMFAKEELYMIEANYNENNIASANLLTRLGFKKDGVLRERRIDRTTYERCSLIVCSIKKNEYKEFLTS